MIKKVLKIILWCSLVRNTFCLSKEEQSAEERIILDTHCNNSILKQYIKSPKLKKISKATPGINEICPKMKYTCCAEDEIESWVDIVRIKVNSLAKMETDLKNLLNEIESLKETGLNKLINMGYENKCFSEEDTLLTEAFKFIVVNKAQILKDLTIAKKFIVRRTASFMCEFCLPEMGMSPVHFRTDRSSLLVENDYCKKFYTTDEGFTSLKFFHYMGFIEPFSSILACLHGSKTQITPYYPEKRWKILSKGFTKCQEEFEKKSIIETRICVDICRKMSPLNRNIFQYTSSAISLSLIFLKKIKTTKSFEICTDIIDENKKDQIDLDSCVYNEGINPDMREDIKDIETFEYYIEPNSEFDEEWLVDMEWSLSRVEGINLENNLMIDFVNKGFREMIFVMMGIVVLNL